jgi:D-beta-D-heptose 7-phosphate kinase/D-beta-D-heptose 1-phosphate adenosyltransferase
MRKADIIEGKIFSLPDAIRRVNQWRVYNKTVAFTNGCFDILHRGHIYSLSQAAKEADYLVVGLNSDTSTRQLKGPGRPINDQQSRAIVIASLLMVDMVVIFDEETPLELIKSILPDVLVKGGDYSEDQVAGAKEVKANGGRIVLNSIVEGFSTTGIIQKMKQ